MRDSHNFKNKIIIITGASSGIGKACAYEFALRGAKVVLAARREDELKIIENVIYQMGGDSLVVKTDVRNIEDCKNLIDKTIEKYKKIDILINNAGISMRANFEKLDLSVIKEVMDTNFYGTVYCTKFALPFLIKQKGLLIGISSVTGLTPLPGRTGYAASKYAMDGFLKSLRLETVKKGLDVLIVHPYFTASNIRKYALNENGQSQINSPRDEARMMSAEKAAQIIASAADKRDKELVLTIEGKVLVWLHKNFPRISNHIILHEMSKEPEATLLL